MPGSTIIRRRLAASFLALVAAALAAAGLFEGGRQAFQRTATYFPVPIYSIEAVSGNHTASLLNLPIGQPGVPQVPTPVDVDGDLLPDILVGVNLIDARAILQNPPNPVAIIAPNVEVTRAPTAIVLGKKSPPVKLLVKLTATDLEGSAPDVNVRFGYDTGPGGSIPAHFIAVLGGLSSGFNPIDAVVDTGPLLTKQPTTYEGPLQIIGGLTTASTTMDLKLAYDPFPGSVRVTYLDDDAGQHIDYAHGTRSEVDLDTTVHLQDGADVLDFAGRVDRLPRSIHVDLDGDSAAGTGSVAYRANSDERLPDVGVKLDSSSPGERPLHAEFDIEALPPTLDANWSAPKDGPLSATLNAGGAGIGAIDVDIRNYDGSLASLPFDVPTEQQFISVRQVGGGTPLGPDSRISGRFERVRNLDLAETALDGLVADLEMGDGELPLEVNFTCEGVCNEEGTISKLAAHAVVSPLPDHFGATFQPAGLDQAAQPMIVTYTSSQTSDVDTAIELHETGAAATASCGELKTTCANLAVRHLPVSLTARIADIAEAAHGVATGHRTEIDFDSELRPGAAHPDITVDATLGGAEVGDQPLVAHADALQLPNHVRARMHERIVDPATGETTLDRAEFHGCEWDFAASPPACEDGTEGEIGGLVFGIRNFLVRPSDLPPAATTTPLYATLTARGTLFEATGRVTDIAEVQYVNDDGLLGVRTDVGGGKTFGARFDIRDSALDPDTTIGDLFVTDPKLDMVGEATVRPLPTTFDLCFRRADRALLPSISTFTAPCEGDPFDHDRAPSSVHFTAGGAEPPDVDGSVDATTRGTAHLGQLPIPVSETNRATVGIDDIPQDVTIHVEAPPADTDGPIKATYDASAQVDIDFSAQHLRNDSVCLDPRKFKTALCIEGLLENLPTHASLDFNPLVESDNFSVLTTGANKMNIRDLRLTSVQTVDGEPQTLIAKGEVVGIPRAVRGTLYMPPDLDDGPDPDDLPDASAKTVDLCASEDVCDPRHPPTDKIDEIHLDVQNFVVPDPTPDGPPDDRAGLPANPDQQLVVFGRGEAFRASLDIEDVAGGGFQTAGDQNGRALETMQVRVDFGVDENDPTPPVLRAYADIDQGTSRTIADATLRDVPAGLTMCFRGADLTPNDPADPHEFCDVVPTDDKGAFQMVMRPGATTDQLDIDAYLRQSTGGDADVLAGVLSLTDLPWKVEGTFPAQGKGSLDVAGYTEDDELLGFGEIDFEIGSFDIPNGYPNPDQLDIREVKVPGEPFPAPSSANQHVSIVAAGQSFHARGRIEGLAHLAMRDGLCDALNRDDYPTYPDPDADTSYTCIRTDVVQGAGKRFDVHAEIVDGKELFSLTNAGITALPTSMQMTIADTPTTEGGDQQFRDPCQHGSPDSCMPPLIRFDSLGAPAELFGQIQIGNVDQLDELEVTPVRGDDSLEFGAPTFDDIIMVPSDPGARAKIGIFEPTPEHPEVLEGVAAMVGVRVPVPHSLTVDQPQTWSEKRDQGTEDYEATDLRFHYVARNVDGSVIPDLGDMKALLHFFPTNKQIQISGGVLDDTAKIPGELALNMFLRDNLKTKRMFVQLDGTTSTELDLRATIFGKPLDPLAFLLPNAEEPDIDKIDVRVEDLPPGPYDGPDGDPSFRVQAEIIDDSEPEEPSECDAFSCGESESRVRLIHGVLDLQPDGVSESDRAHLVKAVVRLGSEQSLEVAGYKDVSDTLGARIEGNAQIDFAANLEIDPLRLYAYAGIPFIGSLEFSLDAMLDVGMQARKATSFTMSAGSGLRVMAEHKGASTADGGLASIGPIDLRARELYGGIYGALFEIIGGELVNPYPIDPDPVSLDFFECNFGDLVGSSIVQIVTPQMHEFLNLFGDNSKEIDGNDSTNVIAWPDDSRLRTTLGPALDFVAPIARSIMCPAMEPDELPLISASQPGTLFIEGHHVPDVTTKDADIIGDDAIDQPVLEPPVDRVIDSPNPTVMCGGHVYGTLTIRSEVVVSDEPLGTDDCPNGSEGRPNDTSSRLTLNAKKIIIENNGATTSGAIHVDALVTGECTLNSINYSFDPDESPVEDDIFNPFTDCEDFIESGGGAGHVGEGGEGGASSDAGREYGVSWNDDDPDVEAGWRGGGSGGGKGGGVITLTAEEITVQGPITADGEKGDDVTGDDCGGFNDGDTADGGGSGGGIAILAPRTTWGPSAFVHANGGSGGIGSADAHGGGGGSGGGVKIRSAIPVGYDPTHVAAVEGGGGTSTGCVDGDPGEPGEVTIDSRPQSRAHAFSDGFWQTTDDHDEDFDGDIDPDSGDLFVKFSAAAGQPTGGYGENTTGFNVVLCGMHLDPSYADFEQGFGILSPSIDVVPPRLDPCGTSEFAGIPFDFDHWLNTLYLPAGTDQITFDSNMFHATPDDLETGYWGFYTRTFIPSTPGNDCFKSLDFPLGLDPNDPLSSLIGTQYDVADCATVEPLPGELGSGSDFTFGIDNVEPSDASIEPVLPAVQKLDPDPNAEDDEFWYTNSTVLTGTVAAQEDLSGFAISGIDRFRCWEQIGATARPFECNGDEPFIMGLSDGDGVKHLRVRAYDLTGNTTDAFLTVVLDTDVPSATLTEMPKPDSVLSNGWFSVSPDYDLSGFVDPPDPFDMGPAPPHPEGRYAYQIDGGTKHYCAPSAIPEEDDPDPSVCHLSVLPGPGRHTLYYTARDLAGNEGVISELLFETQMSQHEVKVDADDPLVAPRVAPDASDGHNGWYRTTPFVGVGTFDLPVGGSGVDPSVAPSLLDVRLDANGDTGDYAAYDNPFELGQGSSMVCGRARDVAGNPQPPSPPVEGCLAAPVLVDSVRPSTLLFTNNPVPSSGWFTGNTPVTVSAFAIDTLFTPGSGVNQAHDADLNDLCGPEAFVDQTGTQPSGICISVDGAPFAPYAGAVTLAEGTHDVRAFAIDVAGNRGDVNVLLVNIDRSHPVSVARFRPATPARNGWWRSLPSVVLRATDGSQNAGVKLLEYRVDNGAWTPYTGPFTINPGTHSVQYRASDKSSTVNDEIVHTVAVPVDIAPPVAVATTPDPAIWLRLFGLAALLNVQPANAKLQWQISDTQSANLQVTVLVYDALGKVVARLNGGTQSVTPGVTKNGFTLWDGKDSTLGGLVPLGLYHYRVVVTDEAGNTAQSGESKPIQIKVL